MHTQANTSPLPVPPGTLMTYSPMRQHQGEYVKGFDWRLYMTGTYRTKPEDDREAVIWLKRYVKTLTRAMHFNANDVGFYGALEDRYPGERRAVRRHWHFVLRCPDHQLLTSVAAEIWYAGYGKATVEPYDPGLPGTYYLMKLVADGAIPYEQNTGPYRGPADLIRVAAESPYVPDHAKHMVFGETLVVR